MGSPSKASSPAESEGGVSLNPCPLPESKGSRRESPANGSAVNGGDPFLEPFPKLEDPFNLPFNMNDPGMSVVPFRGVPVAPSPGMFPGFALPGMPIPPVGLGINAGTNLPMPPPDIRSRMPLRSSSASSGSMTSTNITSASGTSSMPSGASSMVPGFGLPLPPFMRPTGEASSDPIALQNEVQKSLILVQQSLVRQPGVPAAFADRMRHELVRIGQNSVQVMRLLNRERHEMQRSYQNAHETLSRLWNERNAAIQQRDAMGRELTSLRQELNAAREAEVRLRRQLEANQQEFARKYREIQKELSVKLAEIEHTRSKHNWAKEMNPDLKVQLLQSFGVPLEKLKELGIVVKDSSGNLTVKGTHIEPLALTPFSRGDTMPHPASSDSRCAMTAEPRPPVTPQPSDNTNDDGAMPVRNSSSLGQTNSQTPGMRKPWMMPSGGNPAAASNSGASSSRLHPASASATSTTMVSQNHGDLPLDLRRLQSMIQQLYSLCDGWISKNASEYMPERDQETLASNDALVQYLCRLTYPSNRQHALSHLVTIMSNKMGRDNLLLRMFTEFFVNRVWPVTEWLNMKPSPLSLKLKAVFQKLHRTGLSPYDRERLVLERTNIISEILDTEEYRKYRQAKLSTYTAQLKSILGPLLDKDANRQDAGAELNSVVLVA